jgi:hypothetical protein
MDASLKKVLVPALRSAGFTGSWPNWRRVCGNRSDLVNIQHLSIGGTFFINIGQVPAEGFRNDWRSHIPAEKLTVSHATASTRVQPEDLIDGWTFGPRSYDEDKPLAEMHYYEGLSQRCVQRFSTWGEHWFEMQRQKPLPGLSE